MAFWDKWLKDANKFRITIEVPDEFRDQIVALAAKLNVSPDAIATRAVMERVAYLSEKLARDASHARAMDEAYAALDTDEDWNFGPDIVMPLPLDSKPATKLPIAGKHPCRHFDPAVPKMFLGGQVAGSCTLQGGKPCLYPANVATNCNLFFAKAAPVKRAP